MDIWKTIPALNAFFNSDAFYVDNPIQETSGSGTETIFVKPPRAYSSVGT